MSNTKMTFAEIVRSNWVAKTGQRTNESNFINELRAHDSSKTNQQNIADYLNVMSITDVAGLGDIVKMLTNHTNLQIVDGGKPETKVNSHGNLYKTRKDEGYETATTYKIAFKAKLAAESALPAVDGMPATEALTVGPWDALYALHSGYKSAPKALDRLTEEENQARVDEWQRRADFMTAFLAGQALVIKLAKGEEGADDYEPALVIEPEQYNGSLIELASAIKKAERKAKAAKSDAELTPAEKVAKKVATKKAAIKKLMDELAGLEGGKEAVAELVDDYSEGDEAQEAIEAQYEQSREAMIEAANNLNLTSAQIGDFFKSDFHDFYDNVAEFEGAMVEWVAQAAPEVITSENV